MTDLQVLTEYDPSWPAAGTAAKQAALPVALRRLHQAILRHFLDSGGPPVRGWLDSAAGRVGLDPDAACADLAAADLVHLDQARTVRVAYPFSGVPTGHVVRLAGAPPVWSMCAVDALGIPQMADREGVITAADPYTGDPVSVQYAGRRWCWDPPTTTVLFVDVNPEGEVPAAQCMCPHVNFVTRPDTAQHYLANHPELSGALFDQQVAVKLAADIFGPLLDPIADDAASASRL
jgi:alkylmercury lyase